MSKRPTPMNLGVDGDIAAAYAGIFSLAAMAIIWLPPILMFAVAVILVRVF